MIPQHSCEPSEIRRAILLTVAYADVFDYPLTADEIHRYLTGLHAEPEQVREVLDQQVVVQQTGNYYTLPRRSSIVELRQQREKNSVRLWRYAIRYGRLIAYLPFIRMVAVTGSLAVNNSGDGADIDYLVVTAPDRLWLCRAMVLALGHLAEANGVNLCPNYFITTRMLHFIDQNLYAAHEVAQMIPLSGLELYNQIRSQNDWVKVYLPNADSAPPLTKDVRLTESAIPYRQILETLLQNPISARLEKWEMDRKIQTLEREQGDSPESRFSADYCKGHSNRHATHTDEAFNERLRLLALEGIP